MHLNSFQATKLFQTECFGQSRVRKFSKFRVAENKNNKNFGRTLLVGWESLVLFRRFTRREFSKLVYRSKYSYTIFGRKVQMWMISICLPNKKASKCKFCCGKRGGATKGIKLGTSTWIVIACSKARIFRVLRGGVDQMFDSRHFHWVQRHLCFPMTAVVANPVTRADCTALQVRRWEDSPGLVCHEAATWIVQILHETLQASCHEVYFTLRIQRCSCTSKKHLVKNHKQNKIPTRTRDSRMVSLYKTRARSLTRGRLDDRCRHLAGIFTNQRKNHIRAQSRSKRNPFVKNE